MGLILQRTNKIHYIVRFCHEYIKHKTSETNLQNEKKRLRE